MKKKFYVLLAGDNAGKSTILNYFHSLSDWEIVSYDSKHVPDAYDVIRVLDDKMEQETLSHFPSFSPEFKTSLYSPYVYYLRDQVIDTLKHSHVLCNSYYYKILAKDRLQGGGNVQVHNQWRDFPKPDKVLYLDTAPEVAVKRITNLNSLFTNEYEGDTPSVEGFVSFQTKLRTLMLEEIQDIPHVFIPGNKSVEEITTQITSLLSEDV